MSFEIRWYDPFGNFVLSLTDFMRLEYARGENKVGFLKLDLDPSVINPSLFRVDARLEPWRTIGALPAYLDGEAPFFLRKWGYKYGPAGEKTFRLECVDSLDLLNRRVAAYKLLHTKDEITSATADDALKVIVEENLTSDCDDTTRSIATYLTVAAKLSLGATIYKQYSYQNILRVMQEICDDSFKNGTYLAFDIVRSSSTLMEFRTYTGQRGVDRGGGSNNRLIFGRKYGNLKEEEEIEDHSGEVNYVYGLGPGEGSGREVDTASDTTAIGLSAFNRCEGTAYAGGCSGADAATTTALVTAEASAELFRKRYKRTFSGKLVDREGCLYGVHYRYGDILYAEGEFQGYDAHLNSIHVTYDPQNGESLDLNFKAEV